MPEVIVTVRGSFEAFHPPERATIAITVGHEGADKGAVHRHTSSAAGQLSARFNAFTDPERGPITWWSAGRMRTWSTKPFHKDGKQLPLVHHAAVGAQAKFSDFGELARFVDEIGPQSGIAIDGITWALTEARRLAVAREVRQQAVRQAAERAADYAGALGLSSVEPVAIADVGMLGDQVSFQGATSGVMFARGAAAPAAEAAPFDLSPEDIGTSASVDVRFRAS